MDKYKITVGSKAYSFHDQSTGITICRGEEKELSARQYRTKKIQLALNSGHLRLVIDKGSTKKYSDDDIEKLDKKMKAQFEKGMEIKKIAKAYTLEEATLVAAKHEIIADKDDTVETIIQVLLEEFEESKK